MTLFVFLWERVYRPYQGKRKMGVKLVCDAYVQGIMDGEMMKRIMWFEVSISYEWPSVGVADKLKDQTSGV